jgi:hypothetical protein
MNDAYITNPVNENAVAVAIEHSGIDVALRSKNGNKDFSSLLRIAFEIAFVLTLDWIASPTT